MFWSEPFSTFVFVEMVPLYETFTVRINWNLYGMNWHCIWMKKVSSYWTDLRYSWTYAVVVKPCEGWLKLSKIIDLIESIDGWVVGGLKFFRLKRKLICFYFRLLCCCFLIPWVFVMSEELARLKGSRKAFERRIVNLQGEISDLLSHEINEQNECLKNSLMKCRTKFERKSPLKM